MRILATNATDSATLTATPAAVATLPVTNLQNSYREQVCRWSELDAQQIAATWTSGQPINCVALYRTNFAAGATWRVRLYSDSIFATTIYDSGVVDAASAVTLDGLAWGVDPLGKTLYTDWDYGVSVLWFDGVVAQSMTIDIADPSNATGYPQASRLFAGAYFECSVAPSLGANIAWMENTAHVRTEGGSLRTEKGASWRVLNVTLDLMSEVDRLQLSNILREQGMRSDMFVSVYPGIGKEQERDYQLQAKLLQQTPMSTPYPFNHQQSLVFGEV